MLATPVAVCGVVAWSAVAAVATADLVGDGRRTLRVARALSGLAAALTLGAALAVAVVEGPSTLFGAGAAALTLAAFVSVGALALGRRASMRGVNALVGVLGAVLLALFLLAPSSVSGPRDHTETLLYTHVGLVLSGVGAFALAAITSILLLVQERQLRARQFGRLFQRLPSLEELDAASFRLVVWGFVAYTTALALGFVWLSRADDGRSPLRAVLAVVAWATFAAVIHTRITMGWRGRRAAWMTIAGCAVAFSVLAGYVGP